MLVVGLVLVASAAVAVVHASLDGAHRDPDRADCGNLLLSDGDFTPLTPPPDAAPDPRATTYFALNNRGQAVGAYAGRTAPSGAEGLAHVAADHAVLRDAQGGFTRLDAPGALVTLAFDLNDRAEVVGQTIDAGTVPDSEGRLPSGAVHGFISRGGEVATIDVPEAALTQPLGINDRGDVVGAYVEAVPGADPYAYNVTGRRHGFLLRAGRFTPVDVPGSDATTVSGINDRGQMVGYYDRDGARHGFLMSAGRVTRIDRPGARFTVPSRIDDRGRVVGGYGDPKAAGARGFLWDDGDFTTIVAPGVRTDTLAYDINDRGDIVIPADGTVLRQPKTACGRPTAPDVSPGSGVSAGRGRGRP